MKKISLGTVLHIEDDSDIRNAVRFGLKSLHGVHVRVCSSGKEGLLAASTYDADLLLLDVMMPEIDGPMALAGLRQHPPHRHTPAIFLTAFADDDDREYYRKLGAAGVIAKPFVPELLYDNILEILRRYRENLPIPSLGAELGMLDRVYDRELSARLTTIQYAMDRIREEPRVEAHQLHLRELVGDLRIVATGYGKTEIADAAYRAEIRLFSMRPGSETVFRDLRDIESDLVRWAS